MLVEDFDYPLPPELIAQHPAEKRDASRLLVLNRSETGLQHRQFSELPEILQPGDVLVFNDSRVVPARLRARKSGSGGNIEVLLAEELTPMEWWVMLRPGKRVRPGTLLDFLDHHKQPTTLQANILEKAESGLCRLRFTGSADLFNDLERIGEIPLPPYIHRPAQPQPMDEDRERYQTVYAREPGSVAAPTAGLHFTPELLQRIQQRGITCCHVTLHVGLGTFAPIKCADVRHHQMHAERFSVTQQTADILQSALKRGRRIVSIGTTTVRVLEHLARENGTIPAGSGTTSIFIYPPESFRVVGALITNFHLPKSSLLLLISAFACPGKTSGRDRVLQAYQQAIEKRYRFFSYGDAMLIQ